MSPTTAQKKRGVWKLLFSALLMVFGLLAVGAVLRSWVGMSSLADVSTTVEHARPWLTLWRLALFGLVIGYWPRWITWLAKTKQWDQERHQFWLDQRGRIALWWLAIELLVMQNTLGTMLGWLL